MAIHGISLDAAGTIIQVKEPVAQTYSKIANRHGIPIDAATIGKAFRTVFPRMSPLAFGATQGTDLQRQEREWWRTVVRNCLGRFGQHQGFKGFFDEVYQHYAEVDAWFVYEDVGALLARLEAHAIPVIVVSNFDSRLHNILRGFSLYDAFREVLCSSMAGSAKPDPRIFIQGCAVLNSQPRQILHVGDDRRADYDGARNAGLCAQWLNRQQSAVPEQEEIATLNDVVMTTIDPSSNKDAP
jgi:putative hydrolase of the HAD superfamily